jgi:hypothetical protein
VDGQKTDGGPRANPIIGTQVDLREWVWLKLLNRYAISVLVRSELEIADDSA